MDKRSRIGDWEADTVIGKKRGKALAALAERKSRYCMIVVAEDEKASSVSRAVLDAAKPISKSVVTVTCGNGKEFALREELSRELEADRFFAHPYRSWERGLNENTNGLVAGTSPREWTLRTWSRKMPKELWTEVDPIGWTDFLDFQVYSNHYFKPHLIFHKKDRSKPDPA